LDAVLDEQVHGPLERDDVHRVVHRRGRGSLDERP
jgi:hypothetical protein